MKYTCTHLNFDGTTREAMTFYQKCLGGQLTFMTIGETPMKDRFPADRQNRIMHASLNKDGRSLVTAADMMDPSSFTKGDTFSVVVECESEKEIRDIYQKLSAGGKVFRELQEEFWGALFAMFTDKFGVDWMLNFTLPKK